MVIGRLVALCLFVVLAACDQPRSDWHATNITGAIPALEFSLTRVGDGASVHASDYRGKIAILYFGYTHCPDVCPATLANLSDAIQKLGSRSSDVRVLFVTVDPNRDSSRILSGYVKSFSPAIDGLRGSDDQLIEVTRRYRVIYSVTPNSPGQSYEVMHSAAVFFFDRNGRARLVTTKTDNVADVAADLKQLLDM